MLWLWRSVLLEAVFLVGVLVVVLHMQRWLKVVLDVLDRLVRAGVSLSGLVDLTSQWHCVFWIGTASPVTQADLRPVVPVGC